MVRNNIPFYIAAGFCVFMTSAADARSAKCLLEVDGQTYIDGLCNFELLSGGTGDFRITRPDGRYFAYLYIKENGIGRGHWNGALGENRAHDPLGALRRDGACWTNTTTKLCAW